MKGKIFMDSRKLDEKVAGMAQVSGTKTLKFCAFQAEVTVSSLHLSTKKIIEYYLAFFSPLWFTPLLSPLEVVDQIRSIVPWLFDFMK